MIDWIEINDSARVTAVAYDPQQEIIYTRFPNGVEWQYLACPPNIWADFMLPTTSKGRYISQVLDHHPNQRFVG